LTIFGKQNQETTVRSFDHIALILSIHYLVKFGSSSLAVYNNEFILGSACIASEMINRIATKRVTVIIFQKVTGVTADHLYYSMCSKCSPSAGTQAPRRWRRSPTARSV